MGGLEYREPSWRLILVTIYEVSVLREKAAKMGAKIASTNHKNRTLARPGAALLRILRCLAGVEFSMIFCRMYVVYGMHGM